MESKKFVLLVNELLEPKLKRHIRLRNHNPNFVIENHHEESIAMRPRARACDDCGEVVIGRVIFIEKRAIGTKNERWQKKCGECGKRTPLQNMKEGLQ
jgi:hypothetical protein